MLAAAVAGVVAILFFAAAEDLENGPTIGRLVTWALLCGVANTLPVPAVGNVYLSMSSPVNIAIAALFPPGIAAGLVAASSLSEWEIKRETTFLHALYNRAQLGLAAGAAAALMGPDALDRPHFGRAGAAVVAYHAVNWGLVAAAEASVRRVRLFGALRGLVPASPLASLSYFTLGFMGLALAVAYDRVGAWAVVLLMLPLLGARHAVTASRQLEEAERAQRSLATRLIDERERERARIAADIHDVVLQDLAALQLISENVKTATRLGRTEVSEQLAGELEVRASSAINGLRQSIASLRRTTFDEAGLAPTLARYIRSFSTHSGIDVRLSVDDVNDLPLTVGLLLYECTQEALTNVARHARATRATVAVERVENAIELSVTDDGIGVPDDAPADDGEAREGGSGLGLMREKVELSGGSLVVTRALTRGSHLRVRLPIWRER